MRKGEDPSAENPTVTKWTTVFAGFFGGFAMAAAAVQFYRDISALEAGTVRMVEVHRLVYSLYQLGGKWGVIGVLVLVALLLFALGAWALTWPSGGTPSRPRRHRRDPDDGGRPRVRARTVDHTPILVAGGVLAGLLLIGCAGCLGAWMWVSGRDRDAKPQAALPVPPAAPQPAPRPVPPPAVPQPDPVPAQPPADPGPRPKEAPREVPPRRRQPDLPPARAGTKAFPVPPDARVVEGEVTDGRGSATFLIRPGGKLHGGGGSCTFLVESGGTVSVSGGSCTVVLKKGATYDSGGSGSQTIYYEQGANIINAGGASTLIPCDAITFER
jgi:hypothetical protein